MLSSTDMPSLFHSHASLRVSNEKFARDDKFIKTIGRPLTTQGPEPPGALGVWAASRRSLGRTPAARLPRVETPATLSAAATAQMLQRSRRAVLDSLDVEHTAKQRVVRLRRDLARSRSQAALSELRERNRAAAKAKQAEIEYLRGAHLKGMVSGVKAASPAEVTALARTMVEHMEKTEVDPSNRGWYVLFKRMDMNGDGLITYAELMECIRDSMHLDEYELPEVKVQAVWNSIDLDGNGWIDCAEFGRFFRQGEAAHAPVAKERRRKKMLDESRLQTAEEERLAAQAGDIEAERAIAEARRLEREARELERSLSAPRLAKSRGSAEGSLTPSYSVTPSRAGKSRAGSMTQGMSASMSATSLPAIA